MKLLILAAGYGTRLYPLTRNIPKALLPVGEKPMIDHIVEKIQSVAEIDEVFVVTNHKYRRKFIDWVENRDCLGKRLKVIDDGTCSENEKLGAVGDLEYAMRMERINDDILVIAAENLFESDLVQFTRFATSKRPYASIGVFDVGDKNSARKYGVIGLNEDGRVTSFEEKPREPSSSLIATALYFLPAETLALISKYVALTGNRDELGGYIGWLSKQIPVYGFVFKGRWYDIRDMRSYYNAYAEYKAFELNIESCITAHLGWNLAEKDWQPHIHSSKGVSRGQAEF